MPACRYQCRDALPGRFSLRLLPPGVNYLFFFLFQTEPLRLVVSS
jgi:hypothetical protein